MSIDTTRQDLAAFLRDRICRLLGGLAVDTKLESAYADRLAGEILEKWPGLASVGMEQGAENDAALTNWKLVAEGQRNQLENLREEVFAACYPDARPDENGCLGCFPAALKDQISDALARRATAPTPQREDGFRAGLLRAAEIADARVTEAQSRIDDNNAYAKRMGKSPDTEANAYCENGKYTAQCIVDKIRTEAASPPPDLTTPYVPRVVDMPDGASEWMLEDVPVYEDWVRPGSIANLYAADDHRLVGVRWPTRALPVPHGNAEPVELVPGGDVGDYMSPDEIDAMVRALPAAEPVAWQFRMFNGNWIDCSKSEYETAVEQEIEARPLYAAPPAPVPAGEVTKVLAKEERYLTEHVLSELSEDGPGIMPGDVEGAFHRIRAALAARETRA